MRIVFGKDESKRSITFSGFVPYGEDINIIFK